MTTSDDRRIDEEIIDRLYSLQPIGLIATSINGIIVTGLFWHLVPHVFLFAWFAALIVHCLLRVGVLLIFKHRKKPHAAISTWRTLFVAGMIVAGCIWGGSAFFMLFHHSLPHDVFLSFAIGGMAAGAAGTFSALRSSYYGFALPAMIPTIVIFLIGNTPVHFAMAAMIGIFSVLISIVAETNRRVIYSTFRLRYEREALIDTLTEERNEVQHGNENLRTEVLRREELERELRSAHAELERKIAERTAELAQANKLLQDVNKELVAFTHSVSHDLRAPLQNIDFLIEIFHQDYSALFDETGKKSLSLLSASTARMKELIEDLLMLSRVTQVELKRVPSNLSALADEIAASLRTKDPDRKAEFIIQPDCSEACDPKLIRIAMENLFANAWKFTGKNDRTRIEFGLRLDGTRRIYFVADNGVGFNMAYAEKLFQPFQRLHSTAEFPGTGIGLATVYRIIKRHHGTIWAESGQGKGSTFYFTLQ